MRVNINISPELLKRLDHEADRLFLSRSSFIAFAVSKYFQYNDAIDSMKDFSQVMDKFLEAEKARQEGLSTKK